MDAAASGGFIHVRRNARSVRQSRVVLAPRPWRQAALIFQRGHGGKKGRFPGESTKETVKPLRGESRDCLAEPVVTTHVSFLCFGRVAAGAVSARLSLRPFSREGQR